MIHYNEKNESNYVIIDKYNKQFTLDKFLK